ncbi:cag pathogenicity island protein [Campylobacter fetus subsp. venerealis]|uniref:Cpp44 n=1 Tax=Campylobacter hyointestinalis subsp. hyointestinalis TaxID=91352 RepID=A0A9W5APS3_CAMHY|nr:MULTISPECIES: cag pathogenicity island Cag12 family protein [Campylobacter]MBC3779823.1 cag pathogenicity island protein [Campylobacter fetus subsp. fetus]MBC3783147.1 cag pathogenicity island protein [Campylobacter fetus subsp. venerealis]MBK3499220.1 cag pathogenicity island protein [Campylobacter fetus subsp. venerealis]MBK3501163.1 cag pathogenicity island protein [Campylobacter fetus subsp. venerealis]MBK3503190.1 cag pathogenicity island protein [Campylobacter fetus subsp. venerealis]
MKTSILSVFLVSILVIGCGSAPKPAKLQSTGSKLTLNNSLLEEQYKFVPKDMRLQNLDWIYQIQAVKNQVLNNYLENDQVVRTFLVAHNASKIIIVGEKNLIAGYKEYFIKNGVDATIDLQPINIKTGDKNMVNILFFHTKESK